MIVGPFGSGKGRLVERLEAGLASSFEMCPTAARPGNILRRRLAVFNAAGVHTPEDAARHLFESRRLAGHAEGSHKRTLVFRDVDLFDEDSLEALQITITAQRVGVVMTGSSESRLSRRFGRSLRGSRGLRLALSALSDEEVRKVLRETLGAEPTAALHEYLKGVTDCFAEDLRTVALSGCAEGWIALTEGRSALLRSPIWLDRRAAQVFCQELESVLSEATVDLLRQIALAEQMPTLNLFSDAATRDTVDWCEEAGLLRFDGGYISVARQCHRHPLILSPGHEQLAEWETAADILHQQSCLPSPDAEMALLSAKEHLERGLLDQARFLLSSVPSGDPRVCGVEASVLAVSGAPRAALAALVRGTSDADVPPDVAALETFVCSALLSLPSRGASSGASSMEEVAQQLGELDDFHPQIFLEKFPAPSEPLLRYRPSPSRRLGSRQPEAEAELLAHATQAALDAYAAVLAGDARRTNTSLAVIMSASAAELPIVASAWILERVGLTRILGVPCEDVLPEEWIADEAPDRRLLHAITTQALTVLKGIFCGVDAGALRLELDDLWLQFEVGLPLGNLSRRLLEALDFVVSGRRSEEVFGPTGHIPSALGTTFRDVCVDVVALMGRLLHTSADQLIPTLTASAAQQPLAPGMQRTAMRCLLLRRTAELPPHVMHPLLMISQDSGVEPEVIQTVQSYLERPGSAGRELLTRGVPNYPAFRFCVGGGDNADGTRHLLHDFAERLSERETDVTARLINGFSAGAVAEELGISVRTVQAHIRSIYRKLGVGSRLQLLAMSAGRGEIE
jgi:DNA-binding CsgD family transcriptional regulator